MKGINMNDNDKTQETRGERFGKWWRRNGDETLLIAMNTAIIGGTIGLFVWAYKADKKAVDTYNEEIKRQLETRDIAKNEALARGAQVLPTGTGEYWVMENGQTSLI